MSFIYKDKEYNYEYKFDCNNHSYVYEKMTEIIRDEYHNENEEQTELYSLKDFSYEQSSIRGDTTDIQDKYSKGVFGAIPEPDLISTLLEVENNENA